ncbi:hypothetical protein Q8A73_011187 [Channa argus]|nr:hypothetical protein Q8A73_011187 [Channa argus]
MRSGKSWSQGSDSPVGQSVTGSRSALANSSILWACPSPASKKYSVGAHRARLCCLYCIAVCVRVCARRAVSLLISCHGRDSTSDRRAGVLVILTVEALLGDSPFLFRGTSGPDGSGCGAQQRPPVRLQLDHHQTMGVAEPSCSSAKCFYYYSPLGDNYEKKQQQEVKKKEKQRTERRQTCSTCGPPSLSSRAGTPAPADTQRSKAALWSPLGRNLDELPPRSLPASVRGPEPNFVVDLVDFLFPPAPLWPRRWRRESGHKHDFMAGEVMSIPRLGTGDSWI